MEATDKRILSKFAAAASAALAAPDPYEAISEKGHLLYPLRRLPELETLVHELNFVAALGSKKSKRVFPDNYTGIFYRNLRKEPWIALGLLAPSTRQYQGVPLTYEAIGHSDVMFLTLHLSNKGVLSWSPIIKEEFSLLVVQDVEDMTPDRLANKMTHKEVVNYWKKPLLSRGEEISEDMKETLNTIRHDLDARQTKLSHLLEEAFKASTLDELLPIVEDTALRNLPLLGDIFTVKVELAKLLKSNKGYMYPSHLGISYDQMINAKVLDADRFITKNGQQWLIPRLNVSDGKVEKFVLIHPNSADVFKEYVTRKCKD